MKILHITDIHKNIANLQKLEQQVLQKQKFDLIIFTGDYYSYKLEQLQKQQNDDNNIEKQLEFLNKYAQLIIVAGNHDQQFISRQYQPNQIGDYQIIYQSGSSSTILTQSNQYICDKNFWQGYPYGPFLSDEEQMKKLKEFQEPLLEQNKLNVLNKDNKQLNIDVQQACYNENQNITEKVYQNKVIVITHQGPYNSATSQLSCYGYHFTSGSPALENFYAQNQNSIKLWIHGHTHNPKFQQYNTIVNPGALLDGNYGIYEIQDSRLVVNFYKI